MSSLGCLDRADIDEFLRGCRPDYESARTLGADALINKIRERNQAVRDKLLEVVRSLKPMLPDPARVDVEVSPTPPGGAVVRVSDGGVLVVLGTPVFDILGEIIRVIAQGIETTGEVVMPRRPSVEDARELGLALGHYLELGSVRINWEKKASELAGSLFLNALAFLVAHEINHALEAHSLEEDMSLTGFQDYIRIRAQEYQADRRATAMITAWSKDDPFPEHATCGAQLALIGLSWLEDYRLAPPFSLAHPAAASRLIRLHLSEGSYWKANNVSPKHADLSNAILWRAMRLQQELEAEPSLLSSPINQLIQDCLTTSDFDRFTRTVGFWFALGDPHDVAHIVGRFWGSAELYDQMDGLASPSITSQLFRRIADILSSGKRGATTSIAAMIEGRDSVIASGVP